MHWKFISSELIEPYKNKFSYILDDLSLGDNLPCDFSINPIHTLIFLKMYMIKDLVHIICGGKSDLSIIYICELPLILNA